MNWTEFWSLIFFALGGQIFFVLLKLKTAFARKDFTWTTFTQKNWMSILASFWGIIMAILLVASSEFLSDKIDNFEAVFIGWSGADFLKNMFKKKEDGTV